MSVLRQRKSWRASWPAVAMGLLTVCSIGPLYKRGFVLQYDMVFAPFVDIGIPPTENGYGLWQGVPVNGLIKLLSYALPVDIIQKILLSAVLWLCMYSLYRTVPVRSRLARFGASLMYAFNPFLYDRFLAGHWRFLIGYALLPFFVQSVVRLAKWPSRRQLGVTVLWWTLMSLANAQHILFGGMVLVCLALTLVRTKKQLLVFMGATVGVVLANSWWILPAMTGHNVTENFTLAQFQAFRTRMDMDYGLWVNMLSLHGFWYETGWKHIKDFYTWWALAVLLWLIPVYIGLAVIISKKTLQRRIMIGMGVAALCGLIYASGLTRPFSSLNTWIFSHIPGMSSLREPQKMLSLLALVYAYLAAFGFAAMVKQSKKWHNIQKISLLFFTTCILMTMIHPYVWGFSGQSHVTEYPRAWYGLRQELVATHSKVVVLPWQLYSAHTLTDKTTANPAIAFFQPYALASNLMALPGVAETEFGCRPDIHAAITKKDRHLFTKVATSCGATHVIITERGQNDDYAWLIPPQDDSSAYSEKTMIIRLDRV